MSNIWVAFSGLLPKTPLLVGAVRAIDAGVGTSVIELPGGGLLTVRGTDVEVGKKAFVRSGLIEGQAPDLDVVEIEV